MFGARPASHLGLREDQLDFACNHFGPVLWMEDAPAWRASIARDQPAVVYVLAAENRTWRVVAQLGPHDPLPEGDLRLRYHRRQRGLSQAIRLDLTAHGQQAAD